MSEPIGWLLLIIIWAGIGAVMYSPIILIPTVIISTCFSAYSLERTASITKFIGWLTLLICYWVFNEPREGKGLSIDFIFFIAFTIISVIIYLVISKISNLILKELKARNVLHK